ncbi:glycosyltransferase family 4 protein [Flavobacteriaceae bacterium]|nr:glycosyltransferase family 4 protein [Flavobacteriaceae bacterium]
MKVAILIEKIEYGGIQSIGFGLAKMLNKNGDTVQIVHGVNKIGKFCRGIEKINLGKFIIPSFMPFISIKFIFKLACYLYKHKPDVIHSMGFPLGILASILTFNKTTCIVTSQTKLRRGNKFLNRFFINFFVDKVIITSEYHKSIFPLNINKNKFVIIPNMIELSSFDKDFYSQKHKIDIPLNKNILLSVGRLTHGKRVDIFLSIIQEIAKKDKNILGVIVGEGPARKELEELTIKLNINKYVRFEGRVDNILDYFNVSNILVHTTELEIQPMLLIEAGAFGLPVVCSNIGGNKSVINNHINGLMPLNNTLKEYVNIIENLLSDELLTKTLVLKNKEVIGNKFSSNVVFNQYCRLYKSNKKNNL